MMSKNVSAMRRFSKALFVAMAGVALIASCSKEPEGAVGEKPEKPGKPEVPTEQPGQETLVHVTFNATAPNAPASRTTMTVEGNTYLAQWNRGDVIGAAYVGDCQAMEWISMNAYGYGATIYPFTAAESGPTASFSGTLKAGVSYNFFYPTRFPERYQDEAAPIGAPRPPQRASAPTRSAPIVNVDDLGFVDAFVFYPGKSDGWLDLGWFKEFEQNPNPDHAASPSPGRWEEFIIDRDNGINVDVPFVLTSIPELQFPQTGAFDGYADVMVSTAPVEVGNPEDGTTAVTIDTPEFKHLVSFLRLGVKDRDNNFVNSPITSLKLEVDDGVLTERNAFINLETRRIATAYLNPNANTITALFTPETCYTPDSNGNAASYLVVLPGTVYARPYLEDPDIPNRLTVSGETKDFTFSRTVSLQENDDINFYPGQVTTVVLSIRNQDIQRRSGIESLSLYDFDGSFIWESDVIPMEANGLPAFVKAVMDLSEAPAADLDPVDVRSLIVTSSDENVAVGHLRSNDILKNGSSASLALLITPKSTGTATITVSYGEFSQSFSVHVKAPQVIPFKCAALKSALTNEHFTVYHSSLGLDVPLDYNRDGEISRMEAEALTQIPYSSLIRGNSYITSFDELGIYFPNVTSIASSAFSGCNALTSITMPKGIRTIESNAFYYCTALTKIRFLGEDPPTADISSVLTGCNLSNLIIYVPNLAATAKYRTSWEAPYTVRIRAYPIQFGESEEPGSGIDPVDIISGGDYE